MYSEKYIQYLKERGELSRQEKELMTWLQDHPKADWNAASEIRARLANVIDQRFKLDKENFNKEYLKNQDENTEN